MRAHRAEATKALASVCSQEAIHNVFAGVAVGEKTYSHICSKHFATDDIVESLK